MSSLPASKKDSFAVEWAIRRRSTNRLIKALKHVNCAKIAEVGCGNGWLTNYLSESLPFDFCGIDINGLELTQAARVFGSNEKINYVFADIFSIDFCELKVDVFILAAGVQYFPNLSELLQRLLGLLGPLGEIHILDSPFYEGGDIEAAKERGRRYFTKAGVPGMERYYFYQNWESIRLFPHEILYNPSSLVNKLRRVVLDDSPFPWIRIRKTLNKN